MIVSTNSCPGPGQPSPRPSRLLPDPIFRRSRQAKIKGCSRTAIILNRNGLLTGYGNRWTRERVTSLRSHHRIPVYRPTEDGIEPWLNLSKAAQLLHVAPKTLRLAAEANEIDAVHPLPEGPWIFNRAALTSLYNHASQHPSVYVIEENRFC